MPASCQAFLPLRPFEPPAAHAWFAPSASCAGSQLVGASSRRPRPAAPPRPRRSVAPSPPLRAPTCAQVVCVATGENSFLNTDFRGNIMLLCVWRIYGYTRTRGSFGVDCPYLTRTSRPSKFHQVRKDLWCAVRRASKDPREEKERNGSQGLQADEPRQALPIGLGFRRDHVLHAGEVPACAAA